MKYKTRVLVDRFVDILSKWQGVECVTVDEAAMTDILDPYYALILDVFCSAPIPGADERCHIYGDDVAVFESSGLNVKDRFLIGDIPVRLEYKFIEKIENVVSIAVSQVDSLWLIKDSGTYGFYRLSNGEVAYSRGNWIHEIRKRLEGIGAPYWTEMRAVVQSKMEHFLSDLGAASFQGDEFHYLLASAGFIKTACLTLFCINQRFEPSHRAYYNRVMELPVLPPSFSTQLDNFLATRLGDTMERRFNLARLIAKGIVTL